MKLYAAAAFIALVVAQTAPAAPGQRAGNNIKTVNRAFSPGERLAYAISWSGIFQAGAAVMEVASEALPDGKRVYRLTSSARSTGIVSMLYTVEDIVQSLLDEEEMHSISYQLSLKHGKRKKRREMTFDQAKGEVTVVKDGKQETHDIPVRAQDSLSSLYYIRTREDLAPPTSLFVDVFDSGKNWSVEVQALGRERLKTVIGEIDAIKVRTYPKYEGVFQHTGEILIWFTDDSRRIPVLMKSRIAIGSIVATLTEMKAVEGKE